MNDNNSQNSINNLILNISQYEEFITPYESAMGQITARLNSLNNSFGIKGDHNPIHHFQSRIKSPKSITEKLSRRNLEVSLESAMNNLTDIAGLRVICYYEYDVMKIVNSLKKQTDMIIVKESDYISIPKANGYKSYHIIIEMPVFNEEEKQYYPVEIQIRTLTQDLWASFEHQLHYKLNGQKSKLVEEAFLDYSKRLEKMENELEEMFKKIEN